MGGAWSCNGGQTIITLRQDPTSGDVAGGIFTPGQPELGFEGYVVEDELIYTTGSRHEPTTFTLHLAEDLQVLRGRWEDFRGGSGHSEMRANYQFASPAANLIE